MLLLFYCDFLCVNHANFFIGALQVEGENFVTPLKGSRRPFKAKEAV